MNRTEKKTAFVFLALIGLGFYTVSLLFFMGNPMATDNATGMVNFHIDNVTAAIPKGFSGDFITRLINISRGTPTCSSCGQPPLNTSGTADPASAYSDIYAHVGNISITLTGSASGVGNMAQKVAIAVLLNKLFGGYSGFAAPSGASYALSYFLYDVGLAAVIVFTVILAIAALAHFGDEIAGGARRLRRKKAPEQGQG